MGIRPNEKNRVTTGRETFILPVDWGGEFPVFENGLVPMEAKIKVPKGVENKMGKEDFFPNGNFTFNDNLNGETLDYRWVALRGPREEFVVPMKDGMKIIPFTNNIKKVAPTSTLFHRQQHNHFKTSVKMSYVPQTEKELAGMTCYQSERFNYVFGITKSDNNYYILLERTERGKSTILASEPIQINSPITLQIEAKGDDYQFSYAPENNGFTNLGGVVSGDILSTNVAGGFTGNMIGLYATADNDAILR